MKKFFSLLFAATTGLTMNICAQQNKFDIGVEGSGGIRLLIGNPITETYDHFAANFTGGAFFQYNFPKRFSVRTVIAYERKGSFRWGNILDNNGNANSFITHYNLDYITVPILFRYTLPINTFGKKIDYFANAGPYFAFMMSASSIAEGEGITTTTTNLAPIYKSVDMGVSAGLGLVFPITEKMGLSFEARNNFGLSSIQNIPTPNDGPITNNTTNFILGFTYKLGVRK